VATKNKKIRYGDIVHLASGGPRMTVTNVEHEAIQWLVSCVWFDADGNVRTHRFAAELLRKFKKPPYW
jgi:uncharacterized protein YodC (DUF2158 family)